MAVAPNEPAAPPAPPAAPPVAPAAAPAAPPATSMSTIAPAPVAPDPNAPPAPPAEPGKLILKERPAWLGETFYDPKTGEVKVEALAQNAADLKAKLSSGTHKPPADANGYTIDFTKETDPDIKAAAAALIVPTEDGKPDPVLSAVQADALKEGVSVHAFNTVLKSYLKHVATTLPEPFDEAKEMAKLGQNGPAMVNTLNDWAAQQVKTGKWDEADLALWKTYNYKAEDSRFLYKMLFDAGLVPEIKVAAMTHAASTPDAATLDAEVHELMDKKAKGQITDAQYQQAMEANAAKREKLYGKDPTRSWPPAA